jgi:hypothetical protein
VNAFSDGRLGLWHTSPTGMNLDYAKAKDWGVTDIFLPANEATLAMMDEIRSKPSADGKNFRAQVYLDGTHGETGKQLVEQALAAIRTFKPGVLEVNFESGDDNKIGVAVREFLTTFRDPSAALWRRRFPLCIDVVPLKGYVLPFDLMNNDPDTYGRIQPYYGAEMRPADPVECLEDWLGRGFPRERLSFIYSAKARRQIDNTIFCDLPVFSDRGEYVRRLRRGAIFNANLMREAGLL